MKTAIRNIIKNLPLTSGVYLMKNKAGKIIYVGKAVSLQKRVQSYFRARPHMNKTDKLVEDVVKIDTLETVSEAEALILEAHLIKKYQPKYNVFLRDDKSYPYIEINGEDFPRVCLERPKKKKSSSLYYGPYVNAGLIREAIQIIRKIFKFRTCQPFPDKECLDYHIGLCDAPCIGEISKKEYAKNISRIKMILEGKKDQLLNNLNKDMESSCKIRDYEQAAKLRDQIRAIGALYSGTKDINYFKEAEQLMRSLNLPKTPQRIETFDISNIMGNQAVGSMVAFLNGRPDKKNYRRFRIKEVKGIDDFQMIAEVVRRRYSRLKREGRIFPDLIVIDGGKGQLSAACRELEKLEVVLPILSLAKREEEVFLPRKRQSIKLPKDSLGLKLLQRMRDEAHRFAINYHKNLRGKKFISEINVGAGPRARPMGESGRHRGRPQREMQMKNFKKSNLTPFQWKVLQTAMKIPFGQTRSYKWVAEKIGKPKAVRAVGQALRRNPYPVIIPCHRVIREDGSLAGYVGGPSTKKEKLLNQEREIAKHLK